MKIGFLAHSDLSIYYFRMPIMRALKARGHKVYAITPKGRYFNNISGEFNSILYDIDRATLNPFKILKQSAKLAEILKPLELDMLQTSAHRSNIFGTFAAKKAGIKKVVNLVEGLGSLYSQNNVKNFALRKILESLYKRAFRLSDFCIFVNDSDPDYMLKKNLISDEKIRRIKSVGIDASEFDPSIVKPKIISQKKVVLMISRALLDKGVREFYDAAKILSDEKDCQFVFVGDTFKDNPNSVQNHLLEDKNVIWIRWSDMIKEILAGAYLYVLPSYKEGFSRTVLEAMSMAKPCVVSRCDGCIEAVEDGKNGLLCDTKSSSDLAEKIKTLLNNESLAKMMGKNGRNMVLSLYDQPMITTKYIAAYREFVDV